jgi:hypothetical protein
MNTKTDNILAALRQPWNSTNGAGICLRGGEQSFGNLITGEVTCPYCQEPAACRRLDDDGELVVYSLHHAKNGNCHFLKPYMKVFPNAPIGPGPFLEGYSGTSADLSSAVMSQGDYQLKQYCDFTAIYDAYCRLFLFTKPGHPFHPSAAGFVFICDERLWKIDEEQFAEMARNHWVRLNEADELRQLDKLQPIAA